MSCSILPKMTVGVDIAENCAHNGPVAMRPHASPVENSTLPFLKLWIITNVDLGYWGELEVGLRSCSIREQCHH